MCETVQYITCFTGGAKSCRVPPFHVVDLRNLHEKNDRGRRKERLLCKRSAKKMEWAWGPKPLAACLYRAAYLQGFDSNCPL